jgi:hypothetical protein
MDWFTIHREDQLLIWYVEVDGHEYDLLIAKSGRAWLIDLQRWEKDLAGARWAIKRAYLNNDAEPYALEMVMSADSMVSARDLRYHFVELNLEPDEESVSQCEEHFKRDIRLFMPPALQPSY